jgi:hypothetical protein
MQLPLTSLFIKALQGCAAVQSSFHQMQIAFLAYHFASFKSTYVVMLQYDKIRITFSKVLYDL